ncbi:MAG: HAD domain-containing protein [Pseudomonadota bacterium]
MIVFLDFDGVTHPITGSKPFCEKNINALATAMEAVSNIEVVITSTWREEHDLNILCHYLGKLGGLVTGITPVIDEPFLKHVRYHEVLSYLNNSGKQSQAWLAIDDTHGFYPDTAPVLWTNSYTGFTHNDIDRFISASKMHSAQKKYLNEDNI